MEFGIMTIAESQFTFLMLTGFKIIDVHDTPYNHALLNGAKKCRLLINTVALFVLFSWEGGGCYWFHMKEHLNLLTYLITNLSSFLFDSTCSVADSGTVFSVYNDRDVR